MASYHFRIKSDKKSNGERVSASVHVDYIARQGRFKNEGAEQNSETNSISFSGENIFHDDYFPLYLSDDFGKIFNTPEGLKITGKYSPATLSIALTLAKNFSNDQPLILHGSQKFKNKILQSASDFHLNIMFADSELQNKFSALKHNSISAEQRQYAELTSKQILQNLDEIRNRVSATLPSCANNDPKEFF